MGESCLRVPLSLTPEREKKEEEIDDTQLVDNDLHYANLKGSKVERNEMKKGKQ